MLETNAKPEILVIGGSIAGCAMAVSLHQKGFEVLLVEKDREVRERFKGEFLQPFTVKTLSSLGFTEVTDGPGTVKIRQLRFRDLDDKLETVIADTLIRYPAGEYAAILPNRELLTRLRSHAASVLGSQFMTGATVTPVNLLERSFFDAPVFQIRDHEGNTTEINPALVLGCDGRASTVRKWMGGPRAPAIGSATVGSKPEFIVGAELKGEHGFDSQYEVVRTPSRGTLAIFKLGATSRRCYWNVLASDGEHNKPTWEARLKSILQESGQTLPDLETECDVEGIAGAPADTVWLGPAARGRFLLVGDAVAVTTPLGGQGMTSAMHQVTRLTKLLTRKADPGVSDIFSLSSIDYIGKAYSTFCLKTFRHFNLINFGLYYLFFSQTPVLKHAARHVLGQWKLKPRSRARVGYLFSGLDLTSPAPYELMQLWGVLPYLDLETKVSRLGLGSLPVSSAMSWRIPRVRGLPGVRGLGNKLSRAGAGNGAFLGIPFLKITLPHLTRSRTESTLSR